METLSGNRKPDFLVIGAMKAGTTTLYHDLKQLPGIVLPDKESNLLLTQNPAEACARAFRRAKPEQRCGEVCPDYAKLPGIAALTPETRPALPDNLKVIYLVREPVSRAISHHYFISTQTGKANLGMTADFDQSVRDFPSLIDYGRYATQLRPWIEGFGLENVMVIRFEDYVNDRKATLTRLVEFLDLGIGSEKLPDISVTEAHNVSQDRPVLTPGWRKIIRSPMYRKLVRPLVPPAWRERVRQDVLARPPAPPAPPRFETVRQIVEELAPEVQALRELLGHEKPLWDLDAVLAGFR